MKKGFDKQEQIIALERRIKEQRKATYRLDIENKRMRHFLKDIGYDPDQFRYDDRAEGSGNAGA